MTDPSPTDPSRDGSQWRPSGADLAGPVPPAGWQPSGGPSGGGGALGTNASPTGHPEKQQRGTWRIVAGMLIVLAGAPTLIRGMSMMLLSVVNPPAVPDGTAYAFGVALVGATVVGWGLWLAVKGVRLNNARARAGLPR